MYNLTYDTDYHRKIFDWYKRQPGFNSSDRVGEYSVYQNDNRLRGGSSAGNFQNFEGQVNRPSTFLNANGSRYVKFTPDMSKSYYRMGQNPSYPMFNRNDLEKVNKMNKPTTLQGGGDFADNPAYNKLVDDLVTLFDIKMNQREGSGLMTQGGKFDFKKVKKAVAPIAKVALKKGLDIGLPAVSTALGTAVGSSLGNPVLGATVGKVLGSIGREVIKQKTGYGVGVYKGGASTNYAKRNRRIKRLMAEEGMTYPYARNSNYY